jgi:hypothetical protein
MFWSLAGSRTLLPALAALATALSAAAPARACSRVAPVKFEPDPSLRALDSLAPTPFTGINARVDRHPGTVCRDGECTSTSCGSSGVISLEFMLPHDDQSDARSLGYRVVWLRGEPPRGARFLANSWPLSEARQDGAAGALSLELSYDEVANLDAEIALVAIDRAGNESDPSEPIHLEWSGCTRDLSSDQQCLEDLGCSVAGLPGSRGQGSLSVATLVLLALACRAQRRIKRAR